MQKVSRATVLLGGCAAMAVVGVYPAAAAGSGNTVFNCYGIYYSTDWDQKCYSGGASRNGHFYSVADCTSSGDNTLDARRNLYSTTVYDGADCTFQVVYVQTSWYA